MSKCTCYTSMCVIPDGWDMVLVSPLEHPALCSQMGPFFPPDPSHKPIRVQKQRSKVNEYSTSRGKMYHLTLTPTFALVAVAESSLILRAGLVTISYLLNQNDMRSGEYSTAAEKCKVYRHRTNSLISLHYSFKYILYKLSIQ